MPALIPRLAIAALIGTGVSLHTPSGARASCRSGC